MAETDAPPAISSPANGGGVGWGLFDRIDALPPLTPEERQILDSVRALARDEIATRAEHYDRSAEFPWDNIRAINALGLNAMFVPEAYGGAGLGYAAYLACVRELSKACASTGVTWATNFHATKPLIDFGTEEQKRHFLPRITEGALAALAITEPDAGSDATHMKTRFTPKGDSIVVSGGKSFITSGDVRRSDPPLRQMGGDCRRPPGDLGAHSRKGYTRHQSAAQRRQDGASRLVDSGTRLRGLRGAACQSAR
jgi:hypothetical protein